MFATVRPLKLKAESNRAAGALWGGIARLSLYAVRVSRMMSILRFEFCCLEVRRFRPNLREEKFALQSCGSPWAHIPQDHNERPRTSWIRQLRHWTRACSTARIHSTIYLEQHDAPKSQETSRLIPVQLLDLYIY